MAKVARQVVEQAGINVDQLLEKLVAAAAAEFTTYYYYTILRMFNFLTLGLSLTQTCVRLLNMRTLNISKKTTRCLYFGTLRCLGGRLGSKIGVKSLVGQTSPSPDGGRGRRHHRLSRS